MSPEISAENILMRLASLILCGSLFISTAGASDLSFQKLDDERAIQVLKRRLQADAGDLEALFYMGWYMQKKNYHLQAREYYEKYLESDTNNPSVYTNLGNIAQEYNKLDEAEEYYQKALRINSRFSKAHYNLGTLCLKKNRTLEAVSHFEKSLDQEPANKSALLNLASAHLTLYRENPDRIHLQEARNRLLQAGKLDRTYPHVYYNLAKSYELENNAQQAILYYREALRYYTPGSRFYRLSTERIRELERRQ